MKKLFYIFAVISIASCSDYRYEETDNSEVLTHYQDEQDGEKYAILQAIDFLQSLSIKTRGWAEDVEVASVYPWKHVDFLSLFTDSSNNYTSDTLMWVVNFKNNKGFVLVSSVEQTPEVIAYVEHGSLTPTDKICTPGFLYYMDALCRYLYNAKSSVNRRNNEKGPHDPIDPSANYTIDSLSTAFVPVTWGQGEPYNWFCPDSAGIRPTAGCVPVAIAQILAHHKAPTSYKGHTYDWTLMTEDTIPYYSPAQIAVAELIADVGISVNMVYWGNNKGAYDTDAVLCFDSLGYSHSTLVDYDHHTCMTNYLDNHPVYIRGRRTNILSGAVTSHSWVADGGMVKSIHMYSFLIGQDVRTNICRYLHCNWGAEGDYNGYFKDTILKPDPQDSTYTAYNVSLKIIHGIYPN